MQFTIELRARAPRSKCASFGVKTAAVPWAGKHSRFRRRLSNILNYFKHFVTNAISEGFNSSIQAIKSPRKRLS
ncbi:MAG: transposase [Planctomycetota bacterium]|nr:transposase [Planctomycetota bacterium]